MKKVPLRLFQQKASEYIDDLPIALTRYGKTIAILGQPGQKPPKKIDVKRVVNAVKKMEKEEDFKMCKHGARVGICKHGCKR